MVTAISRIALASAFLYLLRHHTGSFFDLPDPRAIPLGQLARWLFSLIGALISERVALVWLLLLPSGVPHSVWRNPYPAVAQNLPSPINWPSTTFLDLLRLSCSSNRSHLLCERHQRPKICEWTFISFEIRSRDAWRCFVVLGADNLSHLFLSDSFITLVLVLP